MKTTPLLLVALLLSATCGSLLAEATTTTESDKRLHSGAGSWGFKNDESEAKDFNVLLIGDSVMAGYRKAASEALKETANCDIWLTPAHLKSPNLLEQLRLMVSSEKYDIIHFNIGLHGWPEGRIPEGQYEPTLRDYVKTLKEEAQGARLVWASTTPIMSKDAPRELDSENNPTIVERNRIAAKMMLEEGILINDLYAVMSRKLKLGGDKFHWNAEGKSLEAQCVTKAITQSLQSKGLETEPVETVIYKSVGGKDLLLDIYRPVSKEKTPVFIMVHGGGWVSGTRDSTPDVRMGQTLAREGIAFVSIDYRLMSDKGEARGTFDKAMEDISDAYAWVLEHAAEYGFDLKRIGLGGSSAGGHLSSVFAQQCDGIRYFVGQCGQYDLMEIGNSTFPSEAHMKNFGIADEAAKKRASAIHNIRKNPPVTLLMHGLNDTVVDTQQSVRFKSALEKNGGTVELELFETGGHGFFRASMNEDRSSIDVMTGFLKRIMR